MPPEKDHFVRHWTFRRTASVQDDLYFELDHYDRHRVLQRDAESDPFVWRANLLGGGRLFSISRRLREMRTLSEYVAEQGWDFGEGFIVGSGKSRADFLTGKPFLPTSAFTLNGIDANQIETVEYEFFESPRHEQRFLPPLLLIKEHGKLPVAFWNDGPLAYRDKITGIHADSTAVQQLKDLFKGFQRNKSDLQFSCVLNGSQVYIGKATAILKQDIDMLPCPTDTKELEFTFWEKVLRDDVLEYMADYIRLGQNSKLLQEIATKDDLKRFADIFCLMLGSIYNNLQAAEPIFLDGLICQPFYFGDQPQLQWLADHSSTELHNLIYHRKNESLRTIRMLRFYDENVILLVKPDRLRYWIRSTAIWDADETIIDLRNQGY